MEAIIELHFQQLVMSPTHDAGNTLDIVAATNEKEIENIQVTETKEILGAKCSDHFLVHFSINIALKIECMEKEVWVHSKADWDFFCRRLGQTDWNYLEQTSRTVSEFYDYIVEEINEAYSSCAPKKIIYPNRPRREHAKIKKQERKLQNCKRKKN